MVNEQVVSLRPPAYPRLAAAPRFADGPVRVEHPVLPIEELEGFLGRASLAGFHPGEGSIRVRASSRTGGPMDTFDLIVIGAGPAGEAAAYAGAELGASVAVIEHDLFGGECPFWACMPSKTLLSAAARRACDT